MIAPNIGEACSTQDGILANRLCMWLAKIENAIGLVDLDALKDRCKAKKVDYEEKVEPYLYVPADFHTRELIVVIITDLEKIAVLIEDVEHPDARAYLRYWHGLIMAAIEEHPDVQAYKLNKNMKRR